MTLRVENCIFFLLARANQAATRFWTACLTDMDITAVQAMILNFLGQEDAVTSRELSERSGLDPATLTALLDRLVTSGLVERRPHPNDRRAVCVCLTLKGRNRVPLIRMKLERANSDFLATLNDAEQVELRRLLLAVRKSPASSDVRVKKGEI
ncbi:MAG TPA: MarR family transcriptional regulator [Deltaproteobacteria bacterium]|nr:MarR family transcriptional regulator [Deltaproteobacteria bacterium]